jgi:MFS superfamily sulfate permease-like transporter
MLLSGLLVISYRNSKRHSEQISIINKQENQITQVELKNKEAELVNLSTFALSKNDLLANIIKELDYHITLLNNKEDQKSLKPLKKKIQNSIDDGFDWESYKAQFTNVYPNFVEYLFSHNPEITNSDIKFCCYLKMNMNTKDIAQLFGLTVRAIENKRYRLRKKLNLETETSLMTFINGVK